MNNFKSIFRNEIYDLIQLKRSIGYKYIGAEKRFRNIDQFLYDKNIQEKIMSRDIVMEWCTKRPYEANSNLKLRVIYMRIICQYLQENNIDAFIYPLNQLPKGKKYIPHIYTDSELKRLFKAIDLCHKDSRFPYRQYILPILFRLLYTCGFRIGELLNLKISEFDLENGIIYVNEAKGKKNRIVPVGLDMLELCREYFAKVYSGSYNNDEYFFPFCDGKPIPHYNICTFFKRCLWQADISHNKNGPRVHDLRHTFCCNALIKLIKENKDISVYLGYLVSIMGHDSLTETAYYLKLIDQDFSYLIEKMNDMEIVG